MKRPVFTVRPTPENSGHRLGEDHFLPVPQGRVEAAPAVGMAGGPGLLDDQQQAVPVAVDPELDQPLEVPRGRPLPPELAPRTRPVGHLSGLERDPEAFGIHPGHHEDFPAPILGDGGDQALRVEAEACGVEGGHGKVLLSEPFSGVRFRPI